MHSSQLECARIEGISGHMRFGSFAYADLHNVSEQMLLDSSEHMHFNLFACTRMLVVILHFWACKKFPAKCNLVDWHVRAYRIVLGTYIAVNSQVRTCVIILGICILVHLNVRAGTKLLGKIILVNGHVRTYKILVGE